MALTQVQPGMLTGNSPAIPTSTAVGTQALNSNSGANNSALGYQAGYSNTTGTGLTAIGYQAAYGHTTGNRNTAIGRFALNGTVTGEDNVGVGNGALYSMTSGNFNTALGSGAGNAITTGGKNTIIGAYSGNQGGLDIRTASNYIVLSDGDGNPRGYFNNSGYLFTPTATFGFQMGSAATYGYISNSDSSSYMQFQGPSNGTPYIIYVRAGSNGVQLNNGATSWTSSSDARLKNVTGTYTNALADIAQLEPVKFTWKSDAENKPQVGVLAQSVVDVVPEAIDHIRVDKENETDYLGVRYTELIPLLVASIQELNAKVEAQAAEIAALKAPK